MKKTKKGDLISITITARNESAEERGVSYVGSFRIELYPESFVARDLILDFLSGTTSIKYLEECMKEVYPYWTKMPKKLFYKKPK